MVTEAGLKNLRPFVKGEQRTRDAAKKAALFRDPKRDSFRSIKYCSPKCPYYNSCNWISESLSREPVLVHDANRYPCYIKSSPIEVQNTIQNMFGKGEEGLKDEILSTLVRLKLITIPQKGRPKITVKDINTFIMAACEVMRTLYGNRYNLEHSGSIVQIIDDIPMSNSSKDIPQDVSTDQEFELLPSIKQIEKTI